jgi:chemotaxis protein methyltransferase CheR
MSAKNDPDRLPEGLLSRLSECLTARIGLHFAERHWPELRQKMAAAMKDFGFDDVEAFIEWLLSMPLTQQQIEILAAHLTVGETYFFREKGAFDILERSILPDLIDARRKTEKRLRFWSAGCSTGEEPYSIAILLEKLIPDLQDWNVTILATDINTGVLRKAKEGIYSDWSFRDTPPFFKDKYFERVKGDRYLLPPRIREKITFTYLNLSEDHYPSLQSGTNAMDVIFCRNVLMYFAPGQVARVAERFSRSLLEGGWLIVSPVETSHIVYSQFAAVRFQDVTLYKKDATKTMSDKKVTKLLEQEGMPHLLPPINAKQRKRERPSRAATSDVSGKPEKSGISPLEEANILYRKGFYREAEDSLRELIANNGRRQEAIVLFAKVLANQGKLEEAFRWCEEAVCADKCNPQLYYLLSTILEEQKRVGEARVSLRKALYLDRNFVLAHFTLANLAMRSGEIAEARKHFDNIGKILPQYNPDEILPESEGITARRMSEIISAIRL